MKFDFHTLKQRPKPLLTLAPMQDVTDHAFWKLMTTYGGADLYCTEYFRVTVDSRLVPKILKSIVENPTGKPVVAQMIGNDIPALVRTARELQSYPIAAVDLNLGCPVPVVYRKCAGGGLLRDPTRVDSILGALRDAVKIPFTVKTRLGFESTQDFDLMLPIYARHSLDLLAVHGRTVKELYRGEVHYERIAEAVALLDCPVLANGNVFSHSAAASILQRTGAAGVMIGRGAIRNPWIFQQIRDARAGRPPFIPTGRDLLKYVTELYAATDLPEMRESSQVNKMKKYLNYIALGVEPTGEFLHAIRRATNRLEFFELCERFLSHDNLMPLEPLPIPLSPRDVLSSNQP